MSERKPRYVVNPVPDREVWFIWDTTKPEIERVVAHRWTRQMADDYAAALNAAAEAEEETK